MRAFLARANHVYFGQKMDESEGLARGTHEVAQHGDVWPVGADTASIHRQAEAFGQIEIHTSIVEFRQAKALRGQNPVQTRRVDRARGAMSLPRTARQLVKLLPIAFVPGRHFFHAALPLTLYYARCCHVGCVILLESGIQLPQAARQNPVGVRKPLPSLLTIYACASSARHFLVYCFKPVTGLIVSRTFALATVLLLRLEPGGATCRSACSREAAISACILRA